MRHTLVLLILSGLLIPLVAAADDDGWKMITDRDDIQVYKQDDSQSRLKTFRGVTIMKLRDEYSMLALYNDTRAFPRWLHMITGASEIKRNSPLDRDYRFLINLPWPLADRDAVLESKLVHVTKPGNESVTAYLTEKPHLIPDKEGYVRIPELNGIFSFERVEPGEVRVTYQVVMDLGGYIPQWLVNLAMRDVPYFTLQKLRRLVHAPKYQNKYFAYLDLFGPGRPKDLPPPASFIYGTAFRQIPLPGKRAATSDPKGLAAPATP